MVAPLITAGARVASEAQKVTRVRKDLKRLGRRAKRRRGADSSMEEYRQREMVSRGGRQLQSNIVQARQEKHARNGSISMQSAIKHKARAVLKGGSIAYFLIWFYPVQFLFALLFIISGSFGKRWYLPDFVEEKIALSITQISWVIVIFIGVSSMLYALMMFSFYRVKLFHSSFIFISFALCLALHIAPYLFIIPWYLVWIGVVIYMQK